MVTSILRVLLAATAVCSSVAWESPTDGLIPLPGAGSAPAELPTNGNFSSTFDDILNNLELIANVVEELQILADVAKTELPGPLANFTNATLFDFAVGGLAYASASLFLEDNVRGSEVTDTSVFEEFLKVTHYTFGISAKDVDWTKQPDPAGALAEILQVPKSDILAFNVTDQLYSQPWYLAVNHNDERLYLVIRGSTITADWLTDAVGLCIELETGGMAHLGFYRSAENLIRFAAPHIRSAARDFPSYKLHVTGHSLGGGVCSISALLLKEKYAEDILQGMSLEANCVSTPPSLDPNTAKRVGNYTYTLFLQDDVVVRSSIHNVANLVYVSKVLGATTGAVFEAILKRFCSQFPSSFFCKHDQADQTLTGDLDSIRNVGTLGSYCKLEVPGILYQIQRSNVGDFSMVTSGSAGAEHMAGVILLKGQHMIEDHFNQNIEHALHILAGTDLSNIGETSNSAGLSLRVTWTAGLIMLWELYSIVQLNSMHGTIYGM